MPETASVEMTLAWAAGLFEGEGWFTSMRGVPVACISMTDRDVIERFRDVVGWGNVYSVDKGAGHKRQWRCGITGQERVRRFGDLIGPWLGDRRRRQLERVLAMPAPVLLANVHPRQMHLEEVS